MDERQVLEAEDIMEVLLGAIAQDSYFWYING